MGMLVNSEIEEWEIPFMRHLKPSQKEKTKRWDYTCGHGAEHDDEHGISYPIGYCSGWTHPDKLQKQLGEFHLPDGHRDRMLLNEDKYHKGGHKTKEQACECYQDYILDFHMVIQEIQTQQFQCHVCDGWTDRLISVETHRFHLCPEHSDYETIKSLFKVGESWES